MLRRNLSLSVVFAVLSAGSVGSLVACGGGDGSKAAAPAEDDSPPPKKSTADAGAADTAEPPPEEQQQETPPNEVGCSEAAKLVYVVSAEKTLYSFDPKALTFNMIGALACDTGADATARPTSMAVDRTGTAWVTYTNGQMFKVSIADATCSSTTFQPGQSGFTKLGMGFSANGPGTQDETLFVTGIDYANGQFVGKGLATVDRESLVLSPVADFGSPLKGKAAELTGTGDGKLYGFFTTSPASLAEIDKTSGAIVENHPLTGVTVGDSWAFSFWGGDFWFYTAPSAKTNPGATSSVTQYKMSGDKSISVVKSDIGFRIVGAGMSTCAPLNPK